MRFFLLLLLVSWVGGVVGGTVSFFFLQVVAVLALAVARITYNISKPLTAAALLIFGLGVIYGNDRVTESSTLTDCRITMPVTGRVQRMYSQKEKSTQFVVRSNVCNILVTVDRWEEIIPGDDVIIEDGIEGIGLMPAGLEGYKSFLIRQGIGATARFPDFQVIHHGVHSYGARAKTSHRIASLFAEPEASVITAMLIGLRGEVPSEIENQFRASGVTHILSISGLHVVMIAGIVFALVSLFPFSLWTRSLLAIAALWAYGYFIEFPVPAVRSLIFLTAVLLAANISVLVSLATTFVIALVLLISMNPLTIFDISFQLSFAAVAGIGAVLFLARPLFTRATGSHMRRAFGTALLVSLGATVGTFPIALYHFGAISFAGILVNLLIVPVVPIFMGLSLLALLFSLIVLPISLLVAGIVHVLWLWIDTVTVHAASLPGAFLTDVSISLRSVFIWYLGIVICMIGVVHTQHRTWREIWE